MNQWIVFGKRGQVILHAETMVRAIQAAIVACGGFARDWNAHRFSTYPAHLQARLLRESQVL